MRSAAGSYPLAEVSGYHNVVRDFPHSPVLPTCPFNLHIIRGIPRRGRDSLHFVPVAWICGRWKQISTLFPPLSTIRPLKPLLRLLAFTAWGVRSLERLKPFTKISLVFSSGGAN